jgi:hypothetical protein
MTEVLHHYVYKIEFKTGHVYFGSRSCECEPKDDAEYLGSPQTHKSCWEGNILLKVILREFDTREEANEYENVLIEWAWLVNKSLSLNASILGIKFNRLGISNTEETRKKISESNKGKQGHRLSEEVKLSISKRFSKAFKIISPSGEIFEGANLTSFLKKENLHPKMMDGIIANRELHAKGWTTSWAKHSLFKEIWENRGISYYTGSSRWAVYFKEGRQQKIKYFKTKEEALIYREQLELAGYKFSVKCSNWEEKLKAYE